MNPIEIVAAVFGVISVFLSVRQNIWSWPTAIVNVGLYIFVFYESKLYADTGLQVIYVVLNAYGWYHWLHGGAEKGVLAVARTPRAALPLLAGLGLLGAGLLGLGLARFTDASLPFWDSSTTAFSLVAQYMQTRKWLGNWLVWIAVDLVYLGIYVYKSLYWMTGLYAVFLVLAVLGHFEWSRSTGARPPAGAATSPA